MIERAPWKRRARARYRRREEASWAQRSGTVTTYYVTEDYGQARAPLAVRTKIEPTNESRTR